MRGDPALSAASGAQVSTPTLTGVSATGSDFGRMWDDLHGVGRDARSTGYRRYAWTAADLDCRAWFAAEASRRGLDLTRDRNGNLWAWWGDPDAGDAVVTGSHLDSVPDGGAFDGPLGVVSAFAAIDLLREREVRPDRPLAVVSFADEEGARFGVACAGSRLLTGSLDADRARALTDGEGTTMAEAMGAAGHDPAHLGRDDDTLARVGTFVELHVEQGRGLVDQEVAVGVAGSIWPHGRWRLDLPGEANHAGTTRLADRDDPMLRLAVRRPRRPRGGAAPRRRRDDRQGARQARGDQRDPLPGAGLARRARRGRAVRTVGRRRRRHRSRSRPGRGVLVARGRPSPTRCATTWPRSSAAHPCSRPVPATTPASWLAPVSPRRCSSSATRPGSATPPPSTPRPTTAWPGSRR